jgi:hypothetical protein
MADEWLRPELLLVAEHLLSSRKVGLVVESVTPHTGSSPAICGS